MKVSYRVVWKGPVKKASGLGMASRSYIRALRRQGVTVTLGSNGIRRARTCSVLIYHYPPHTLRVRQARKKFDIVIVNTVWETTRIPRRWIGPLNRVDAVFVPSRQNRQALLNSGVKVPVLIVPHGVNARFFTTRKKRWPSGKKKGRFVFLSVFAFQHRKNPEDLLRAYWEEFSASDPVLLIIKTKGLAPHENERWIRNRIRICKARLNLRKRTAPVQLIARHLSARSLRNLYARGHAFVLPTRGEGVGLPFLEAMASGLPVIATGWGGHMDFLNSRNSFLVKYRLRPPVFGMNRKSSIARPFRHLFAEKGQLWAEPDIGSLRRQMRMAYENPLLCRRKGKQARRDALKLSWDRAGFIMKKAIERVIVAKRGRRR